jgi:uncharacterized protein YjbI with pentapeptide repeats
MTEFDHDIELRGARFVGVDLSGARFRNVDLSGAKMVDALLVNARLSGLITGLTVNDIEVEPLIVAEYERRFPERKQLFATDPPGLRTAWGMIEEMWRPTVECARRLPEARLHERVDEEWSFIETLRHLVFVTDAWIGRAVLGEEHPYHPIGLAPTFVTDVVQLGLDPAARPSLDEVLSARQTRLESVRTLLEHMTADELDGLGEPTDAAGYPPETNHRVISCVHTVIDEEWAHHRYAVRDLAVLEGSG